MVTRASLTFLTCALATAIACAGATQAEKGRLVPLQATPGRLDAAHSPKRVALVVGIQRFDDPEWRPLRYPAADTEAVAGVLRDPARGAFDEVFTLTEAPSRDELRAALRRLADANRDERDTLVVYVSSHGTLARDGSGQLRRYLVTRDTRMRDIPGSGLSLDELRSEFEKLRSRRKVLILAACHSGAGKSLLPESVQAEIDATKAGFLAPPIEEVSRASVVLAASGWGETAREDETLGNDIYTHFLVEALKLKVDPNGDGATTVSEAHDYARRKTYEFTKGLQRPSAESTEVGADPIVLAGRVSRRGSPELFSYAPRLEGFTVRVDGSAVAELPGGLAIAPGRHRVQVSKGSGPELLDVRIGLVEGERVNLEDLFPRRPEHRWEVAPGIAVMSFLDRRTRADVLGAVPGAALAAAYRGWPRSEMDVRVDLVFATGRAQLEQGPYATAFRFSAGTAGASLPWRFSPEWLGGATLLAGPRLSALLIERWFEADLAQGKQSYFTLTPGLLAGASVPLWGAFTAKAELHLDWMIMRVDGRDRSSGFGELLLGMGYRF